MATHGYPSIDKKDPIEYINSSKLFKYAQVAKKILGDFEDLFVWKVQMKSPSYCNNAWYVGLATHEDPFLMNFYNYFREFECRISFFSIFARRNFR